MAVRVADRTDGTVTLTATATQEDGTVREPAERPSSNLGGCGFESLSCYSGEGPGLIAFGRAVGRQAACKAAALAGTVGSIPTRGTGRTRNQEWLVRLFGIPNSAIETARSSNGRISGCQPDDAGSIPVRAACK